MVDLDALAGLYELRRAAAEQQVAEWRWSKDAVSLSGRLVPICEERDGLPPEPVSFLRRAPTPPSVHTAYGFAEDGRVVVERFHAYGEVSAEQFVAYADDAVDAVRYGHWVVGNPEARNIAIVPEWAWRLVYEARRPVRYEFRSREGRQVAEHYRYGADGSLEVVIGELGSPLGDETWRLKVRASRERVVEVIDDQGDRLYPA